MPNWEEIKKEWETSDVSFKELAEKYALKDSTIRSRKNREKWQRNDATQRKNVATQNHGATKSEMTKEAPKDVELVVDALEDENVELSDVQRFFCLYFVKYLNATKAYQKAYGCSYEVANSNAYLLMVNHGIRTEISRLKKQRALGVMLDKNDVLQKYIDIAFADITDFVEFGQKEIEVFNEITGEKETVGINYVEFKNSSNVDGTIITEVKKGKDGVSVKLADKMKALEFLAKYTDLLSENDRKRLQEEKLKVDITKAKAEAELMSGNDDDDNSEIIQDFIKATSPSKETLEELFGDENEED